MATIDLGKVALVWKGTYAAGTTYESKDVVQFTDSGEVSSYIYVNASGASGQTPSTGGTVNTTYWNKMAGGTSLGVRKSNPGVWCHSVHDLMDRKVYTDWKDYVGDTVIK